MRRLGAEIAKGARIALWWLRQVIGDAGYDNYLRSAARRRCAPAAANACCGNAAGTPHLLTREEFYLDALRRRYSGVSRCC